MPKPISFSVRNEKQFQSNLQALAESMQKAGATQQCATKAANEIGQLVSVHADEGTLARRKDDTETLIAARKHLKSLETNLRGASDAWSKLSAPQRDALTWAVKERLSKRPYKQAEMAFVMQLVASLEALPILTPALFAEISNLPKGVTSRKRHGGAEQLCASAIFIWRKCTGKIPSKSRDGKISALHQHLRNLLKATSGKKDLPAYIRETEFNSAIDHFKN